MKPNTPNGEHKLSTQPRKVVTGGSLLFALVLVLGVPGGVKAAAPDLTVVDLSTIDTSHNYSLGPTGMRGWIYVGPRL